MKIGLQINSMIEAKCSTLAHELSKESKRHLDSAYRHLVNFAGPIPIIEGMYFLPEPSIGYKFHRSIILDDSVHSARKANYD